MKLWQKLGLLTLLVLLLLGARVYFVWKERQDPGVAGRQAEQARPIPQDDLAYVKLMLINSFTMAKQLEGTNVWIKAGYSLPYYPYAGGTVEFAKRVGVVPATEKLAITKIVKAVAPAKEDNRVPHGSKQYFAVFTIAGPDTTPGTFVAPIGYVDGDQEKFFTDQLFYYDDPKTIYDNWPKPVWDAVAKHTPTVGMTENQARMAAGILIESDSTEIGNRTVTYDAGEKKWTVTFQKGVATAVKAG
jgi:hypothetical protein